MTLLFLGLLAFLLCGVPTLARIIVSESLRRTLPPAGARPGMLVPPPPPACPAFFFRPALKRTQPGEGQGAGGTLRRQS